MDRLDLMLAIPALAVTVWDIYGMLFVQPKILVKGRVAGTAGSRIMFAVVALLAVLRPDDIAKSPLLFAAIGSLFAVHSFLQGGPAENYFSFGAIRVDYSSIDFYQFVREKNGMLSVNFHSLSGKDYVVLYKEAQREELVRVMNDRRIRDIDTIHFFDNPDDAGKA